MRQLSCFLDIYPLILAVLRYLLYVCTLCHITDKEVVRPPSADSESGHSRSSSRSGSRVDRKRKRASKKAQAKREELDTIAEKTKKAFG